ncbi:NIPSNAP family protein [Aquamicrobium defluvii]|uniref:NIPSNAP protein n=1 Tax=Aquamicrobium defluvii TaxID=69279 RepID=A0A011UCF2_9HYPH|nr:NIPSNAP family protein [Aquamicrobium defluvii]EXL03618.1 hypothetical protein BG36_11450 [Aquamicrobium defluvii]EZQ15271.1 hypothetical protein CF98_12750 [Halopseudomonas bauzanensis]TDR32096.1 NIPSNAP protein [Aquamicrobium defluvii]
MIVEERIYTIQAGQLGRYLSIYSDGPMQLQSRVLGQMLGYFTTEIGDLSTLVHLWGYESHAERDRRRALLAQESEWQAYLAECTPLIRSMENRIMVPTTFSPIR